MGILNVTPDSFSDGGQFADSRAAICHAREMITAGADIIDVGGESTRPGSDELSEAEEAARVLPVITALADEGQVVSVDTRHASVAKAALAAGAAIINDVSGFRVPAMVEVVAESEVGCVVMHMLGEPKSMQANPEYNDVVAEVSSYLLAQAEVLGQAGVDKQRIAIDPGPGFGKTREHNLALLRATAKMAALGYPLVAAYSRKAFIGAITGVQDAAQRLAGSVAVALWAAAQGARILRVHDVRPTVEALRVLEALGADPYGTA
ncbi:MAG: dihydropteroate synthase [Actinomycetia bacterium]|nr:dihydropteroate synthase [Actinomycetes bacterium]